MEKLLIIADPGKGCHATPRGLSLAAALGQKAEVVAFVYAPLKRLKTSADEQAKVRKQLEQLRQTSVQARIDKYSAGDQQVSLKVVWTKDTIGWINKRCTGTDYSAVVKTATRDTSLLHTPEDWRLMRECPAPVMLVGQRHWSDAKPILATLDLSTEVASKRRLNHKVLGRALRLSQALGADLQVVSGIEIPTLLADLSIIDTQAYVRDAKAEMQRQIKKLAKAYDLPERIFSCQRGPLEKVIADHADAIDAQIVVMGTVGRTGLRAALMGNTAERILRTIKTDVWTMKP